MTYYDEPNSARLGRMLGICFDIVEIDEGADVVRFVDTLGLRSVFLEHVSDCCETVELIDVCGDAADIQGSPIVIAEEVSSEENPADAIPHNAESFTWTFYRFATVRGTITLRWFGQSNGYYSERVTVDLRGQW